MAWIYLVAAGLFEVVWAVGLKYAECFTKLVPAAVTVCAMAASFLLLSAALKTLPVGTAYAIWTGIGACGTAVVGVLLFHESKDPLRVISLMLIVAGIVGLRLGSGK